MTPEERKSLAEQITTSPLYQDVMRALEQDAIQALIDAEGDENRHGAQLYVRAVQSFQSALARELASKPRKRNAPV